MKKSLKLKKNNLIINFIFVILTLCLVLTGYWTIKKERINLVIKGEEKTVNSFSGSVKDLLEENHIVYDEDDIIEPSIDTKLSDYMNIKITYVDKITVSEHERIAYETKFKKDSSLSKGITEVTQEGKEGRKTVIYEEVYHNNKLVSRVMEKEIIREKPTNKIITKGTSTSYYAKTTTKSSNNTKLIKGSSISSSSSNSHGGSKIIVSATAYSGDSITATGTRPRWGTIAVDPRVIPYGTKVYIPKLNMTFVAEDCGGGIKGNKIDIFMNSSSECYNWGVRSIEIYILG